MSHKRKLCNVGKTENLQKEREKRETNPLPSVATFHYKSEDCLSLTSLTADNPQITGSYFIISCRSVPRLSSPLQRRDMWREGERESYWRSSRHYCRWVERAFSMCDSGGRREGENIEQERGRDGCQEMWSHEHLGGGAGAGSEASAHTGWKRLDCVAIRTHQGVLVLLK